MCFGLLLRIPLSEATINSFPKSMIDQAPDDIFALYSRLDLDADNYRVFCRAKQVPGPTIVAPDATERVLPEKQERNEPAITEIQAPKEIGISARPSLPIEPVTTFRCDPKPIRHDAESRTSLQSLWRQVANTRTVLVRSTPEILASNSISVTGVAGGVGTTTIAATLTRLLAKNARRCAIVDDTEDPTLPIYFGAQRITDEHRRFAGLKSLFESRARVVNRKMFDPLEPWTENSKFLQRNFAALAENFDHLVFDRPSRSFDCSGAAIKIHVAVPDLSSLTRIQRVRRDLDLSGDDQSSICVLNRFDPSIALHKELLGWYRENFLDLVVIRDSSLVTEALAEATTIVDWVPDSGVSSDFLNLFATVSQSLGVQCERLPVCS